MGLKVCKFGGSSLCDAAQIQKCRDIVLADPARRYVVPSAPGKRNSADTKITDHLYKCHELAMGRKPFDDELGIIRSRFDEIIAGLGLTLDLSAEFAQIAADLPRFQAPDYIASRGEYLNGKIMAALLGWEFVDSAEIVLFDRDGRFDAAATQKAASQRLCQTKNAVVTAFYGSMPCGDIKTFSRGGADVSGSIVARAVNADVYENWTDVSGFMMADPRIIQSPKGIPCLTYRELRELSYMGATVLHEDAIFPVRQAGIPINVRNTNAPLDEGTMIVSQLPPGQPPRTVTGIAGRQGYTMISLEKEMMNNETGFGRRVMSVLEGHGVSFEHMPTGIDSMSVIVAGQYLKEGKLQMIMEELNEACKPDRIDAEEDIALIATVGLGMGQRVGVSGRLFGALGSAGINVRLIAQGGSELNIITGVAGGDYAKAVKAIYEEFA